MLSLCGNVRLGPLEHGEPNLQGDTRLKMQHVWHNQ